MFLFYNKKVNNLFWNIDTDTIFSGYLGTKLDNKKCI